MFIAYCSNNARRPDARSAPEERHDGTANFAFADGHVETRTNFEMSCRTNADGSVRINGDA